MALSTLTAADSNVSNLTCLSLGMSQCEVLHIMRQPFKDKTYCLDGDIYDVWFYVTEQTLLGQSRLMPVNLTPLTFKNGVLVGKGASYANYLKKKEEERRNAPPPDAVMAPVQKPVPITPSEETQEKPPLTDEDQELLHEESDQIFNQT